MVENVGIEPTKVCLQSNPAPLRIPHVRAAAFF
jgi:hypothetical protein